MTDNPVSIGGESESDRARVEIVDDGDRYALAYDGEKRWGPFLTIKKAMYAASQRVGAGQIVYYQGEPVYGHLVDEGLLREHFSEEQIEDMKIRRMWSAGHGPADSPDVEHCQ